MPGGGRTVYIAGAGIAGLTLALALAKFGAGVVVLERHDGIEEVGAGLQISPNARRVLDRLGLDRQVAARSFEPEGIDLYPSHARSPVVTLRLGAAVRQRFGAPYAVMHRGDLADVLHRACRRFANIEILFGVRGFDASPQPRGVAASVDEAGGRTRNVRAFAFVGADGVNSPTRTRLLGGPRADAQDRIAWRTLLDLEAVGGAVARDRTSVLFGPGYHAVCYPLPHQGKLNVALFTRRPAGPPAGSEPPAAPPLPRRTSERFQTLLAAAEGTWTAWPLATVAADEWHRGAIGLIGDAAHAMLPFQAQGAAMAIEDAAILAPLLMTETRAARAFDRFVSLRRARVDRVARVSTGNGFAFHLGGPLALARDTVLRFGGPEGHLRRLAWLYGYDPTPEVDLKAPARPPLPHHRAEREPRH
jgi:salicylate hydroxylase